MIGEGIVGSGVGEVRSYCGVGFSARGYRALVVDRRRKLLVVSLPLKEGGTALMTPFLLFRVLEE
jgi:hypothetical protein